MHYLILTYVVAVAKNKVMGKDNKLPWYLPNDRKFFRQITLRGTKTMIMGRKTFESLPKVLPGRKHIVLTQDKNYKVDDENVQIIHSKDDLIPYVNSDEEYFVIGGAGIFKMLLLYAKRMYITEIYEDFAGDTFFPNYDQSEWEVKAKKEAIDTFLFVFKVAFLIEFHKGGVF